MSSNRVERYNLKIKRKIEYLQKLANFSKNEALAQTLLTYSQQLPDQSNYDNPDLEILSLEAQNKKLKLLKKKAENEYLLAMSNTRAFHIKAWLKEIPLVACYEEQFQTLENKLSVPNVMNIHSRVFEIPQHMLALESQRILAKTKTSPHVSLNNIKNFVNHALRCYHPVAYHNFSHAFSVLQLFYHMSQISPRVKKFLSAEHLYMGLVASISHDLGHCKSNKPGRTMDFRFRKTTNWLVAG